MLRQLRWQIALAAAGALAIGLVVVLFAHRGFEDRPSRGGNLVEAVVGRLAVLNPLFAVDDAERDVANLLFCSLTKPDPHRHVRPDLATHWSVSADGLTYTFGLRQGAVWHDGRPVTADDVVFTADVAARIASHAGLSLLASPFVRPWERVTAEAVDENTVTLRLSEPYAPFLDATMLGLLPKHVLEGVGPDELANHRFSRLEPIGCGPYRLDLPGGLDNSSVRLVRFDGHWNATESRPYLDAIVLRLYATLEAAVADLGRQDVQAMGGVPAGAVTALGEDAREYAAVQPGFGLVYLNNAGVLFSERSVRQALSLATDRIAIATDDDLLGGQGLASANPIASGSWAHAPDLEEVAYDPAQARRLLQAQGWLDSDSDRVRDREGKPLRFRLATSADPLMQAMARRLQRDWQAVGADPQLETLDQQATVRALSARDFDAMLFSWELTQYDPDPYPLWHSSQAEQGQNYASFRNDDADRVMVDARRLAPSAENLAARVALYQEFQRIFAEEQPSIVLYHPVYSYVVADPNLGGFQLPQLVVQRSDRFLTLPDWFVQTSRVFGQDAPSP